MRKIWQRLQRLGSDEGIAITEYGIMLAFVALALIAVVAIFAPQISAWFARKTGTITTV